MPGDLPSQGIVLGTGVLFFFFSYFLREIGPSEKNTLIWSDSNSLQRQGP